MIAGIRGRLISGGFAEHAVRSIPSFAPTLPPNVARALSGLAEQLDAQLGPASSVRTITDAAILPLLDILGFSVTDRIDTEDRCWLRTVTDEQCASLVVVVVHWDQPLDDSWRNAVLGAIDVDASWCFCTNGRALRIIDAQRTWSREFVEFDLRSVGMSNDAARLLWGLARADAMSATPATLRVAATQSAAHGVQVCRALGAGVLEALRLLFEALTRARPRSSIPGTTLEHALTVLYRVLFLLFAEARGLVPTWHPVYRDRYSIGTIVSLLMDDGACRGLWEAILAISRMAHAGCTAGELKVTAFNGRLFAQSQAVSFERTRVPDTVMRNAILSLGTTRPSPRAPRARIAYRDLDVEQLGAVYERVLDFAPTTMQGSAALIETRDIRKATGTFYTPRSMTAFLVRRTLTPLVENRSSNEILSLRIVDPAMGSGAFLVAALRFLASAVENALIREGRWHRADVTPDERAALRREIASRCLYGVDLNPTAVQVARLSLWLATLAADKPLSFLDHHLVVGNSILGASPDDLRRRPTRDSRRAGRPEALPLFPDELAATLNDAAIVRDRLASEPDDSPAIVREKEKTLNGLSAPGTALTRWSRALDLWCAGWFLEACALTRATFGSLVDRVLGRPSAIPDRDAERLLRETEAIASRLGFLHWPLAFPEVFNGPEKGFDAVIGNPPWDMVRGDSGDALVRDDRRREARQTVQFIRESGIYRLDGHAHVNRYQLFVERALQVTKAGGRIGMVLPSGVVADSGAAPLRRQLFDRADVDTVTGLDNRAGIFPIHRSVRFVLLTATNGRPTTSLLCRFGVRHPDDLDSDRAPRGPIVLTRKLIERISGLDDLGIPELATTEDLRIVERITAHVPPLGSRDGWNVQFGRELNASDDRRAFVARQAASRGRPVVEGKQIAPFNVSFDSPLEVAIDSPEARRVPRRSRLAYRDVASATNRLTLIAAVVPANAVTTHTLCCLRTPLLLDAQHVLCALLNSFVANYLIRLRVNTHVTVSLVSRLRIPVLAPAEPAFSRLCAIAKTLASAARTPAEQAPEYPEMQALIASLYGLTKPDFARVLETFPLIPADVRNASFLRFKDLH